jgi:phosphotransacetylase
MAQGRNMDHIFSKVTLDMPPLVTAVIHPVDANTLTAVFNAATNNLMIPILVGNEDKIKKAAADARVNISSFEIISVEHSHAAAAMGVELVKSGKVEALMKGSLGTDEFLNPIVHEKSLQSEYYMSHVFIVYGDKHPRPFYLTDCAVNDKLDESGSPELDKKRIHKKKSILKNAIDLFWTVEGYQPKVAILAPTEKVTFGQLETMDAAILKTMSDHNQIKGAIVDGPLAYDCVLSAESARLKGLSSPVAGMTNIFMHQGLGSANNDFKRYVYQPDGTHDPSVKIAGIMVGLKGKTQVILTSRSDGVEEREASIALALLNARLPRRTPT